MTTSIQAVIEALPRYDQMGTSWPIREFKNGAYLKREDVLAALQAAPAQGSIDTTEFRAMLESMYKTQFPVRHIEAIIKHIDAHIAQRAARAVAPIAEEGAGGSCCDTPEKCPIDYRDCPYRGSPPAPKASTDEVADKWAHTDAEKLARAERALIRAGFEDRGGQEWAPPIGKPPRFITDASAPDAPAGDLPPFPKPGYNDAMFGSGCAFTHEQMHAYVLADRAARHLDTGMLELVITQLNERLANADAHIERLEAAAPAGDLPPLPAFGEMGWRKNSSVNGGAKEHLYSADQMRAYYQLGVQRGAELTAATYSPMLKAAAAPAGDLLANLIEATAMFRYYEAQHRAKNTEDSLKKAEVNAELAGRFEATIARAAAAPAGHAEPAAIGWITTGDVEGDEMGGWDIDWNHKIIDALPEFGYPNMTYGVYLRDEKGVPVAAPVEAEPAAKE